MSNETTEGSLSGIKIVDCTRVLGGPYCTQMLGDHGAEIIKIEPPQGDEVRDWGPPFNGDDAAYFIGVNRNKRSIGLDLSAEEGKKVLLKLLEEADVIIENYKTGSMERWGLGYEEILSKKFPRLIHCRISGFGADGPYGGFPGYDGIIQAMVGHFSVNGAIETGPTRLGLAMVDIGTGLYAGNAILMALFERERSGVGQYLDMTLYDCGLSLMHPHVPNYFVSGGMVPGLTGNPHPNIAPYDLFDTKTCKIFIAGGNDRAWRRLCEEVGRPELGEDPRFLTNGDRQKNKEALKEELEGIFAEVNGEEFCEKLLAAGLPVGPIRNTEEVMNHEHTKHRNMIVEKDWYKNWGIPIKFSRTPGSIKRLPPKFGEHGREILKEHGYTEEEISTFAQSGILIENRKKI
ncbi:MAG: carnitine dehydratase [Rhodospirillaceae bacterium]|nr:carnitine dehydratase [Rhodospirillaceae bacterium]